MQFIYRQLVVVVSGPICIYIYEMYICVFECSRCTEKYSRQPATHLYDKLFVLVQLARELLQVHIMRLVALASLGPGGMLGVVRRPLLLLQLCSETLTVADVKQITR